MRFSLAAATAILASTVSAGYGYGDEHAVTTTTPVVHPTPSPYPSKAPVVSYPETVKTVVTVDCAKNPYNCPNHKPTSTTKVIQPSGYYGNVSHPVSTPSYHVPGKDYEHGGKKPEGGDKEYEHGGKKPEGGKGGDDDKYQLTTITTTVCVPTTYVTKVLKPTTPAYGPTGGAVKPTGAPVKPTPTGTQYTGSASSMQMGSFAVIAGVAAFILA